MLTKLTAEDGYTGLRSYSTASSPIESSHIELSIERLDDGEVSPFCHDVVVGDDVELRGPLGGHFIRRGFRNQTYIRLASES
jgi:ferredoxin-NADP reductase